MVGICVHKGIIKFVRYWFLWFQLSKNISFEH